MISVIIPVYNVEDYLAQCLESVIDQNLEDIEIESSIGSSMLIFVSLLNLCFVARYDRIWFKFELYTS